jgi:hypothetical protein
VKQNVSTCLKKDFIKQRELCKGIDKALMFHTLIVDGNVQSFFAVAGES